MVMMFSYFLYFLDNVIREVLRTSFRAKRFQPSTDDKQSSMLTVFYLILVPVLPVVTTLNFGIFENDTIQWIGILIQIFGISVRVLAMQTLGRFYTGTLHVASDQTLVTSGVYSLIRHPGYLAVLLVSVGFGLATGNWLVIILVLVSYVSIYSYRIQAEETLLVQHFGTEYRDYMLKTKRIIPFVY